ncbi:hypothetical protein [Streptomyces sp. NPDC091371]|uniref:hypothetical protein n=1 Tax=Streptomyces sp. NPDC091371 TaxID=3155303 RepID=UPI00342AAC18
MDVARRQASGGNSGQVGAGDAPDAVTWRLVGANNHELGRSPRVHSSLAACCASVERLRAEAERVTALVAMSPGSTATAPGNGNGNGIGAWTWQLVLDDTCVAVAVRTFRRQRECRHSLQLFLAAVTEAQVASGVSYTRRLRGLRLPGAGDAPGLAVRGGGLL